VLSDKHEIPPGDTGYFAILSADKDQAQERLETCHEALKALGIAHRKTATEITLADKNVGIKAFAATTTAVVSFTCIGYICDEMARWRDKDTGANPAKQIVTSLRATMLTMPSAIGFYVSAPWSTLDLHHEMVEAGDTKTQLVFVAPTWIANPTITEQQTRDLEPDEQSWSREYAAIPMSSDESKFFSAEFIDAAAKPKPAPFTRFGDRTVAGGDFAFRKNSSALAVLRKSAQRMSVIVDAERIPGIKPLVPSETIEDLATIAIAHGADSIACDLHYIETVRETVDDLELPLLEFPTQSDEIAAAYIRMRVLISRGMLDLSKASPKLITQLKNTTAQPTQTGLAIKNKVVDGAHGDLVSALVCAMWAADKDPPDGNLSAGTRRFTRTEAPQPGKMRDLPDDD
jgi:phage terminase large subunit-like protein